MALTKDCKKKMKLNKRISTDAITYSYMYRQITMNPNFESLDSVPAEEQHSAESEQLRTATIQEVLSWEAT